MIKKVEIKGVDQVMRKLGALGKSDAPFAMAKTLTRLAQRSQHFIRTHTLMENFIIRRVGWARQGVRITPATKQTLAAEIVDINAYMGLQEEGGTKFALGKTLCIPLRGAKRTVKSIVRKEDYPAAVMQSGGFIRGNIMYRAKEKYRNQRRRKGSEGPMNRTRKRNLIIPMYWLQPTATIKKRYHFERDVRAVVQAQFEPEFKKIWNEIVRPTVEWPGKVG